MRPKPRSKQLRGTLLRVPKVALLLSAAVLAGTSATETPVASSYRVLATKVDGSTIPDTQGNGTPIWIITILALMMTAVVLFAGYQLFFNSIERQSPVAFSRKWTSIIRSFGGHITSFLRWISLCAATHPRVCAVGTILMSLGVLLLGLATNFTIETDTNTLWAPAGSKPEQHWKFITSTYQNMPRPFTILVHKQGSNVVSQEGVARVFQALDAVRNTQRFSEACVRSDYSTDAGECKITSVTNFWNHSTSLFEMQVTSDEDSQQAMSEKIFPDGRPVDVRGLIGYPQWNEEGTQLTGGLSFVVSLETSEASSLKDLVYKFEKDAIENALNLRQQWEQESDNAFRLEVQAQRSLDDELRRAVYKDFPLVPMSFGVMTLFVCLVFSKRDAIRSQSLLGFGAVVSVFFAIWTGFGFLFIAGVPLTSLSLLLPLIILGIGLDDAFVITGAFKRTDPEQEPVERIDAVICDVGLSIATTTITSVLAFCLGTLSGLPAVDWLCYYAIPTILIDFFYQITFFVALMVIDQKRIMSNRRDCCVCFSVSGINQENQDTNEEGKAPWPERLMAWYASKLLQGWVKVLVLVSFSALLVGLAYSASLLTQDFKLKNFLPQDSYVTEFGISSRMYSSRYKLVTPYLYFQGVDQSKEDVQRQMEEYVLNMVDGLDLVEEQPPYFWLRDFRRYAAVQFGTSFEALSFKEKLNKFLGEKVFRELYSGDIVLDEEGNIVSSRVLLFMHMPEEDPTVSEQIALLADQRRVSSSQPINSNKDYWPFFAYHDNFNFYEFCSTIFEELLFTAVCCLLGVTGAALVFIPHFSGALFIFPVIVVLYVDLLGFLHLVGVSLNPVTYIAVVIAIGLMVDYNIHILLRYYECRGSRDERVKNTLCTIGSSVLLGALTTFLGILPLAFAATEIGKIIFFSFIGLVSLSALHGLVLLPVLLSFLGPLVEYDNEPSAQDALNQEPKASTSMEATETAADDWRHVADDLLRVIEKKEEDTPPEPATKPDEWSV